MGIGQRRTELALPAPHLTRGKHDQKSAPPTPVDKRPSVVPAGERTVPGLARWLIIVLLGYEVLLPLGGMALAAEFDVPQSPAVTADRGTGSNGVVFDDVSRITLPPGPARLRKTPAPEAARRGRSPSIRR